MRAKFHMRYAYFALLFCASSVLTGACGLVPSEGSGGGCILGGGCIPAPTILAEAMIGPEGGTITTPLGTVRIPEGAFSEARTVSVWSVPISQLTPLPPAITPEASALGVDFDGAAPEKPLGVTMSILGIEELSVTNEL